MTTHTPLSPGASEAYREPGAGPDDTGATQHAGQVADATKDHAAQVAGAVQEQAANVADEAKAQARNLVDEAYSQIRQQVDTQRTRVSELLREISEDLEQMAGRSDRDGVAADLVRQAAARARATRGYLDGGGDIVADVRRYARRRPGTFLLGALAAGVLAGRTTRAAATARRATASDRAESSILPAERSAAQPTYPPRTQETPEPPGVVSGSLGADSLRADRGPAAFGGGGSPTGTAPLAPEERR